MQPVENCINLLLNIGDGIDVFPNGDLKSFLTLMRHYRKHETVVKMQSSLTKKESGIKNYQISTSLHVCYNFRLQEKGV